MNIPHALLVDVTRHLAARDAHPRAALPEGRGQLRMDVDAQMDAAEMFLYDEIGYWGVRATDVIAALADLNGATLTVRINSPGGDVFDAVAIYNALADHPAPVTVVVDSLAASAASFVAMAGNTVRMNRASQLMIHDASTFCYGNASDMEYAKALLDRVSDTIAGIYADRAGDDTAEWRDRMRAETWYDATEAVTAGLADETTDPEAATDPEPATGPQDAATFDLTCFTFAGRTAAPAPPLPDPQPKPEPVQWDAAAFIAQMREVVA